MRNFHTHHRLSRLVACDTGVAFLLATHYSVCEVFAGGAAQAEASHQPATFGLHDEGTPSSDTHADPCCATLQAIVTPSTSLVFAGASQPFFQDITLSVIAHVRFADLSSASSGLSPPARAPTPARPFYRTTFASHAPPVCLA